MLFSKKSDKEKTDYPFAGAAAVVEGFAALHSLNGLICGEAGTANGMASGGQRSAAVLSDADIERHLPALHRNSFWKVPQVLHLACGSADSGGYTPYYEVSSSGYFQMFAQNVQELLDFTLIARRIAELSLIPGIVGFDRRFSGLALQSAVQPAAELVSAYLGGADEPLDTPTASQKMLFGAKRPRVPDWLNADQPLGIGMAMNSEQRFKASAAQQAFFETHLPAIADQALQAFGELTGRFYHPVNGYLTKDAEYLLIAMGGIVPDLHLLADALRGKPKIKLGVLNISMLHPFPEAHLSHLLKGKKGVTVLESTDARISEDAPILQEIRAILEKSSENALARKDKLPFPEFSVYGKLTDRPPLFSGIYDIAGRKPEVAALSAVVGNMLPGGSQKKRFFVGVSFTHSRSRFPKIEALSQRLQRSYPEMGLLQLEAGDRLLSETDLQQQTRRQIKFVSDYRKNADAPLHLFTKALGAVFGSNAAAVTTTDLMHQRQTVAIDWQPTGSDKSTSGVVADNLMILNSLSGFHSGDFILCHSNMTPQAVWEKLPPALRSEVREKQLHLLHLNTAEVTATVPASLPALRQFALIGACLSTQFSTDERELLQHHLKNIAAQTFTNNQTLLDEIENSLQNGIAFVTEIDWRELPAIAAQAHAEVEAPRLLRQMPAGDDTIFDPARFWDSVGYFYATGHPEETLVDPYLASGKAPAAAAAARDLSAVRVQMPSIIVENCTGCAACWTHCPEIALPPTIQDFGGLIKTALSHCQSQGSNVAQLQRLGDPLAKLAYRVFSGDELRQHRTLGAVLEAAFAQMVEKMNLAEDQQKALQVEFEPLANLLRDYPVIRTQLFFDNPQQAQKGSGKILNISVNPMNCSGCGKCAQVCPDNAIEILPQTEDLVVMYRRNWQFSMNLPETPVAELQPLSDSGHAESIANLLLNRRVYHTMAGGDAGYPGSGAKTAAHLIFAAAEAAMQPRVSAFVTTLNELINQLEQKINRRLETAMHINDFDRFGEKLSQLERGDISAAELAGLVEDSPAKPKIDRKKLSQMSDAISELKRIRERYAAPHRLNGCAAVLFSGENIALWAANYPHNAFLYPAINAAGSDLSSLTAGVFDSTARKMTTVFAAVRRAKMIIEDTLTADSDAGLKQLSWKDFSETERALLPPVLVLTEEATIRQQSFGDIAGLMRLPYPVKIAVLTNDALALDDRSPMEIGMWALSQPNAFVLQSTPGRMGHFLRGVRDGMRYSGKAVLYIYAAEPAQQGIATDRAAAQEHLAADCRAFPLFSFDPTVSGSFAERLSLAGNREFQSDWVPKDALKQSLKLMPFTADPLATVAHWAINEGRFVNDFQPLSKADWQVSQVPLWDYLALPREKRADSQPFITLSGKQKPGTRVLISRRMVKAIEQRLRFWQVLQELAGTRASVNREIIEQIRGESAAAAKKESDAIAAEYREKLSALDAQHWQIYHERLTQKLLNLCGIGGTDSFFDKPLKDL